LKKYNFNLPEISKNTMLRYLKIIGFKAGLTEEFEHIAYIRTPCGMGTYQFPTLLD